MINDIKGEKRIDLSYPIHPRKEIAAIIMLSDNIQYKILKLRSDMDSDTKKLIPSGTYAGRELLSMLEGMVELNKFLIDDQVTKTNKLKGITEMIINLDELDNSNRKNDLILIMTPEKQDKTLELSKHWSVDSTPARNEVIMKRTYPVKSVKCDKICSNY